MAVVLPNGSKPVSGNCRALSEKADMQLTVEARAEALRWCQARGQRSGRAAYQFSKHWIGSQQLNSL